MNGKAPSLAALFFFLGCAGMHSPATPAVPRVASLRAAAVAVTPPPSGASYAYTVTTQRGSASRTTTISLTWTAVAGGRYFAEASPPPKNLTLIDDAAANPFLVSGTYRFDRAHGAMTQTYEGYRVDLKGHGPYCSLRQTISQTPAKTVGIFPLAAGSTWSGAVATKMKLQYCLFAHARSGGSDADAYAADGSYDVHHHYFHDNPLTVTDDRATVAADGSASSKRCNGTLRGGSCVAYAWGRPEKVDGVLKIPVTEAISPYRAHAAKSRSFYIADWYPHGVASPLLTDAFTVRSEPMPAQCGAYSGRSSSAVVETVARIDPAAGEISSAVDTAYYVAGSVMPACGVAVRTTKSYANRRDGSYGGSSTTTTTVVATAAP